jgi:chorismate mutase / prephenate dehydratase
VEKVTQEDKLQPMPETLDRCRKEIDRIDREILSLVSSRVAIASEIGKIKRDLGLEITDTSRERETLRNLTAKVEEPLSAQAVTSIFTEIMSVSRAVQGTLTVAYLGPEATFTHQAAQSLYGRSASYRAAETIEEVFGWVEKGLCQVGVVPIENSYEGSVNSTLDLFYHYDLKIIAETFVRIRHYLLSNAANLGEITKLYSHPMAIAQCRTWLKTHLPMMRATEVASTSLAAKMAADEHAAAAIGSHLAGMTYGLKTLEANIEDLPDNLTRFLTIGKKGSRPSGKDKTSLLFFVAHKPGALHKALGALAQKRVNMTRIESRPFKTRNWEYLFFVDIEGHEADSDVNEALMEMGNHCVFMKRLGSYPAGGDSWD